MSRLPTFLTDTYNSLTSFVKASHHLCSVCQGIPLISANFLEQQIQFQQELRSLGSLEASAAGGCALCKVFWPCLHLDLRAGYDSFADINGKIEYRYRYRELEVLEKYQTLHKTSRFRGIHCDFFLRSGEKSRRHSLLPERAIFAECQSTDR
jgi:hypothetical protein